MSNTMFYFSLVLFIGGGLAIITYIIRGRYRIKHQKNQYQWQPEQDYDVVLEGESTMTPGFPVLKKRREASSNTNKEV